MNNETLRRLERRGYKIGHAAVDGDGMMRVAVDGQLLTYAEIDALLHPPSLTDAERKVIDILVNYEITADAWAAPIHAVDRAMGWATMQTRDFVRDLMSRGLVQWTPIARSGQVYDPKAHWKYGKRFKAAEEDE